jgi:hypothetical protein
MAITIIVLNQTTINLPPPLPANITAEFAIQDDAVAPTWYKWTRGGIPANTSNVQAFLDAEASALYADASAGGTAITENQIAILQLAGVAEYYDAVALQARKNLIDGNNLQTSLNELVDKLNNNATEFGYFTSYKNGRGLAGTVTPADIAAMTAVNRQLLLAIIAEWMGFNLAAIARIPAVMPSAFS